MHILFGLEATDRSKKASAPSRISERRLLPFRTTPARYFFRYLITPSYIIRVETIYIAGDHERRDIDGWSTAEIDGYSVA